MIEPAASSGLLGTLGINGKLFIAQLVNFAVILFVLWRWAFKPILAAMDAREHKIVAGLSDADEAKRRLAEASAEQEKMVKQAHAESRALIDEAKTDAERARQQISAETKVELERQLTEAKQRLKREKEAMVTAVRHEVAGLVLDATKKVAGDAAEPEAQRKLIDRALSELERA